MDKTQTYTLDKAIKQAELAEEHFRDFLTQPSDFCRECLLKHIYMLEGFSEEGVQFFPGEQIWKDLVGWCQKVRDILPDLQKDQAQKYGEELRQYRKKLLEEASGKCFSCNEVTKVARHIGAEKREGHIGRK